MMHGKDIKKYALRFVFIIGIVSLFGDMTYEGARSINGAFLGYLGASSVVVGLVAVLVNLLVMVFAPLLVLLLIRHISIGLSHL